jgi:hypothetical protein
MNYRTASNAAVAASRHVHAVRSRALGHRDLATTTIEWEELPSLADGVRRVAPARPEPVWNATLPLGLWQPQPEVAPAPFREPLHGLHVREISGDEVFSHFFGR